jgi:hypothetical protein
MAKAKKEEVKGGTFVAVINIRHNGKFYPRDGEIELTGEEAAPLLENGHIKAKEE